MLGLGIGLRLLFDEVVADGPVTGCSGHLREGGGGGQGGGDVGGGGVGSKRTGMV